MHPKYAAAIYSLQHTDDVLESAYVHSSQGFTIKELACQQEFVTHSDKFLSLRSCKREGLVLSTGCLAFFSFYSILACLCGLQNPSGLLDQDKAENKGSCKCGCCDLQGTSHLLSLPSAFSLLRAMSCMMRAASSCSLAASLFFSVFLCASSAMA